jgi:hypothetical protein
MDAGLSIINPCGVARERDASILPLPAGSCPHTTTPSVMCDGLTGEPGRATLTLSQLPFHGTIAAFGHLESWKLATGSPFCGRTTGTSLQFVGLCARASPPTRSASRGRHPMRLTPTITHGRTGTTHGRTGVACGHRARRLGTTATARRPPYARYTTSPFLVWGMERPCAAASLRCVGPADRSPVTPFAPIIGLASSCCACPVLLPRVALPPECNASTNSLLDRPAGSLPGYIWDATRSFVWTRQFSRNSTVACSGRWNHTTQQGQASSSDDGVLNL